MYMIIYYTHHNMHPMHGLIVPLLFTDPTLTLENISTVTATVTATVPLKYNELGRLVLSVPRSKCEEIRRRSSTAAEERERLIRYYLNYSEYASWDHLASKLYRGQHHDALSAARRFIKTEPGEFICNNNYIPSPNQKTIRPNDEITVMKPMM